MPDNPADIAGKTPSITPDEPKPPTESWPKSFKLILFYFINAIIVIFVASLIDVFWHALSDIIHEFQTSVYDAVKTLDAFNVCKISYKSFIQALRQNSPEFYLQVFGDGKISTSSIIWIIGLFVLSPLVLLTWCLTTMSILWHDPNYLVRWLMTPMFGCLYFWSIQSFFRPRQRKKHSR